MKQTPVIVFGNMKGGSGKTTATITSALAFAHSGRRVGIRDCDSQASLENTMQQNVFCGLNVVYCPPGSEKSFDLVLVDSPPRVNDAGFLAELGHADLFVLVTKTSTLDLQPTAKAYEAISSRFPDLPIALAISEFDDRRRLDRGIEENLQTVGLGKLPLIRPFLRKSEIYRHVVYLGWHATKRDYDAALVHEIQTETAEFSAAVLKLATAAANKRRSA